MKVNGGADGRIHPRFELSSAGTDIGTGSRTNPGAPSSQQRARWEWKAAQTRFLSGQGRVRVCFSNKKTEFAQGFAALTDPSLDLWLKGESGTTDNQSGSGPLAAPPPASIHSHRGSERPYQPGQVECGLPLVGVVETGRCQRWRVELHAAHLYLGSFSPEDPRVVSSVDPSSTGALALFVHYDSDGRGLRAGDSDPYPKKAAARQFRTWQKNFCVDSTVVTALVVQRVVPLSLPVVEREVRSRGSSAGSGTGTGGGCRKGSGCGADCGSQAGAFTLPISGGPMRKPSACSSSTDSYNHSYTFNHRHREKNRSQATTGNKASHPAGVYYMQLAEYTGATGATPVQLFDLLVVPSVESLRSAAVVGLLAPAFKGQVDVAAIVYGYTLEEDEKKKVKRRKIEEWEKMNLCDLP